MKENIKYDDQINKTKEEFAEKLKDPSYRSNFFNAVKNKYGKYIVGIKSFDKKGGYHSHYIISIADNEFNLLKELKVKTLNDGTSDRKKIDMFLQPYNINLDNVMNSNNSYHGTIEDIKFKNQLNFEIDQIDFK
jgi:hypothetical protein